MTRLRLSADDVGGRSSYGQAMKHSMKMMWACAAILVVAVVLSLAGANIAWALFALPCMLMMAAMMWIMMRGMGGGSGSGS